MTTVLDASDRRAVDAVAAALLAGEAVVLPTETVYGLAALPSVPGATAGLFALKGRPADVPLAVLVASAEQAWKLVDGPPGAARRLAERFWPGPLTMVLPRAAGGAGAGAELGGDPATVGVRCPDYELVRAVAARVGPIATTSANRHGEPTPVTAAEAAATLAGRVAVVVDGGRCEGKASTVVDLTGREPRVVRPGPITEAAIRDAIGRPGAGASLDSSPSTS